jgi:guanosine-3',5'-bis(diphosphate) 3'-pyrophosphohydrolase
MAATLALVGGVSDVATLQAAVFHDTTEDTDTTPEELEDAFGVEVRRLVVEVTDDKSLPKGERKRRPIERAPHLSGRTKAVKLADKLANVRDVTYRPPEWSLARRLEYLDWAEQVVAGCRGLNEALERARGSIAARSRNHASSDGRSVRGTRLTPHRLASRATEDEPLVAAEVRAGFPHEPLTLEDARATLSRPRAYVRAAMRNQAEPTRDGLHSWRHPQQPAPLSHAPSLREARRHRACFLDCNGRPVEVPFTL